MKIKLDVMYDGTDFFGWQKQVDKRTVQQTIEEALKTLTGKSIKVTGSGRTDAGTHANNQVAHFKVENVNIPAEKYAFALNTILPNDVKILKSEQVAEDFHAIASAKSKTYTYHMYRSYAEHPLRERFATRINTRCDVQKMKDVSQLFVGTHDFKCVLASGSDVKDTVRTIYSLEVVENGVDVYVTVKGNGFLYNMVRIICGTLVAYSENAITKEQIIDAFNSGDRTKLKQTLPAKGLCLVKVEY